MLVPKLIIVAKPSDLVSRGRILTLWPRKTTKYMYKGVTETIEGLGG